MSLDELQDVKKSRIRNKKKQKQEKMKLGRIRGGKKNKEHEKKDLEGG